MTIVTALNGTDFAAWTITDPAKETDEWLQENDLFLEDYAENSLPAELDDPELHAALEKIAAVNDKYVSRMIDDANAHGYFHSQKEYDSSRALCDSIIAMFKELRNTRDVEFGLWDRLTSDIERRLAVTNDIRSKSGLDTFKSVEG